jgi:hypothetical protein
MTFSCKVCGVEFNGKKRRVYCGVTCRRQDMPIGRKFKPGNGWKGGICEYPMRRGGPMYRSMYMGKGKPRRCEHILIAEKVLGRPLKKGEMVHHIDGDGLNNSHSNLLICDKKYHMWIHHRMSYLYQREHFGGK